jgi:hypothetical protein
MIKPGEIPESYYAFQLRLARERGYGHIELTPERKIVLSEQIIADQKRSLEIWIEYLVSPDTDMYPVWLKYWIFTGIVKLSQYHHESGKFGHRDKGTVALFPELNREALSLVADYVIKYVNKESLESFELLSHIQDSSPEILKLLPGLNFGKIYGQVLRTLGVRKEGSFVTNQGQWVVYKKGSDHKPLFQSIVGYNTGWCTASETNAKRHLHKGDFYVYYSFDKDGLAHIPRVAIRMENDNIAEIRGVGKEQNLDPQINESNVVTDKLKEFGSRADRYKKADHDMQLLTSIEMKQINGIPLTKEDIGFLYEIEQPIIGFGYDKDPRIEKIKSQRDMRSDLVEYFHGRYTRDEISMREELLLGRSKVYVGDLLLINLDRPEVNFNLPEILFGDLSLRALTKGERLTLPKTIYGYLELNKLTTAEGLVLPEVIYGRLDLGSLTTAKGLRLPKVLHGSLYLMNLTTAEGLTLPENFYGNLNLSGLKTAKGLKLPKVLHGDLNLGSLTTTEGLVLPEFIQGHLNFYSLSIAEGLILPETLHGNLNLGGLKTAKGLKLPENFYGSLDLSGLKTAKGLKLPKVLHGDLDLKSLTTTEGLILPEIIHSSLNLSSLPTVKGLKLPKILDYSLRLPSLLTAKGLKLPENLHGYMDFSSLTRADGLVFPETMYGTLDFRSLTIAKGLKLPKVLHGGLDLKSLTTTEGLILPEIIRGYLNLENLSEDIRSEILKKIKKQ